MHVSIPTSIWFINPVIKINFFTGFFTDMASSTEQQSRQTETPDSTQRKQGYFKRPGMKISAQRSDLAPEPHGNRSACTTFWVFIKTQLSCLSHDPQDGFCMFGVQVPLILQKEHGKPSGEQIPQRSLQVPVGAPLWTHCGLPAGLSLLTHGPRLHSVVLTFKNAPIISRHEDVIWLL